MDNTTLIKKFDAAVAAYVRGETQSPSSVETARKRLEAAWDAIAEPINEAIGRHGGTDIVPIQLDCNKALECLHKAESMLGVVSQGRNAYTFVPSMGRDNQSVRFDREAKYFAVDGHGHFVAIRSKADAACWLGNAVHDWLNENWGEVSEDDLKALSAALGD